MYFHRLLLHEFKVTQVNYETSPSKFSFLVIFINFFPDSLLNSLLGTDTDICCIWQDLEKPVITIVPLVGKFLL